ncbi:hypothetical protein HPB49_005152 [Dermacentor silvarum]|uniref:Uncharacterized protein n=1 Tax=Dermacentor silvarum TaxID=543639 RepID=A0ACB8CDB6_DERSI|nr:hypothetical protein HPB49_005152 [Dermacentor silvarum]
MVLKDIATSIDYLATSSINHQIVTILPQKHIKARTIITNVYSPPKEKRADFEALIRYVKAHSSTQDRLLLLGDFNAAHTSWGYRTDTPKGRELEQAVEAYDLQLIILPQNLTRLGNSVSADTFPDLTFTNNVDEVFWTNLEENLGSDHFILSVSVGSPKIRRACGHVVITDWVNYRKVPMPQILPENAEDWATHIRDAHKATSKRIALTAETPICGSASSRTADAEAASTTLILSVRGVHSSDFSERVKPLGLAIAVIVLPALSASNCSGDPSLFRRSCTWQPRQGNSHDDASVRGCSCRGARRFVKVLTHGSRADSAARTLRARRLQSPSS